MMYLHLRGDAAKVILIYPNSQRETPDINLFSLDFKEPSEILRTHATTTEIAWQTKEQTKIREFIVPQRVEAIEVIDKSPNTEHHFTQLLETYPEYLRDTKFIQIVKLYCVFDEAIASVPKEELIVEERIGQNYINDSETSAA